MTHDNRRAAIARELEHGGKALAAARLLREAALYNDALSRLYYALFHHVAALLLTEGVDPSSHSALPGLLGKHFVLHGRLTASDVAIVSRTAGYRNLADYERTWDAPMDVVDGAFTEVLGLVARIESVLTEGAWIAQ